MSTPHNDSKRSGSQGHGDAAWRQNVIPRSGGTAGVAGGSASKPFWRVSFTGHHPPQHPGHHMTRHQVVELLCRVNHHGSSAEGAAVPQQPSAGVAPNPLVAGPFGGHHLQQQSPSTPTAHSSAAASPYHNRRSASTSAVPVPVPLDPNTGRPATDSPASSFDFVEAGSTFGGGRSRLPSVRSMGSLVMIGSPDGAAVAAHNQQSRGGTASTHHHHQHNGTTPSRSARPTSAFTVGSMAATPSGRPGSVSLAELDGGFVRVRDSPVTEGTGHSFPSVSAATPQHSPLGTRCNSPGLRSPALPGGAGRPALGGSLNDDVAAADAASTIAAAASGAPGPAAAAAAGTNTTEPAGPLSGAPRSLMHFKVVDSSGSHAGVGLMHHHAGHHSRDGHTDDRHIATGPAFVNDALSALLDALRSGRGVDAAATSSSCSTDEQRNDGDDAATEEGAEHHHRHRPVVAPSGTARGGLFDDSDSSDSDDAEEEAAVDCATSSSRATVRPAAVVSSSAKSSPGLNGAELPAATDLRFEAAMAGSAPTAMRWSAALYHQQLRSRRLASGTSRIGFDNQDSEARTSSKSRHHHHHSAAGAGGGDAASSSVSVTRADALAMDVLFAADATSSTDGTASTPASPATSL